MTFLPLTFAESHYTPNLRPVTPTSVGNAVRVAAVGSEHTLVPPTDVVIQLEYEWSRTPEVSVYRRADQVNSLC
jgi:hypothetical protein